MITTNYVVTGICKIVNPDGKFWFEAIAMGETRISAGHVTDVYEVVVKGPNDNRSYSGGEGSDAHNVYVNLQNMYVQNLKE